VRVEEKANIVINIQNKPFFYREKLMTDIDVKQKALDALLILNTAIKNERLYPPTSSIIIHTIERLYQALVEITTQTESLILAESEKGILVCGEMLNSKDQEKLQVTAFLNILLNFGIKSITFEKGLEKEELLAFISILSKKPGDLAGENALAEIIAEKNVKHILLDKKVYVALDKDQQMMSGLGLNVTDDQIMQFIKHVHPDFASDSQKLQELAKDPEWLMLTFEAGLAEAMAKKGTVTDVQLSESLTNMMTLLDKVAGSLGKNDQDALSQRMGKAIAAVDPDVAAQVMSQNIENLFGGMLMQYIASELAGLKAGASGSGGQGEGDGTGEGSGPAIDVQEALNMLLKDDKKALLDESLLMSLPKIIEQLIAQKQQETIEAVIGRLMENMTSDNTEVRSQAAKSLVEIIEQIPAEQKAELIANINDRLINWVKLETLATPAYEKICRILQAVAQDAIHQRQFAQAIPILNVFNEIRSGVLDKNDTIHEISKDFIRTLATEEQLAFLFSEFKVSNREKQLEVGEILVRLGDAAVNRLLDILRETQDSDERVAIMRMIIGIGPMAIPLIRERINKSASWFYLRNLAYILGSVGNESSAIALKPLLLHENIKVRQEALKSLYRKGGDQRSKVLLSVLSEADDEFKINIVETLGNMKSTDAVADLLNMLKTKPVKSKSLLSSLEEKICIALGSIRSPEAIPALTEIVEAKSFLRIRSYPANVRIAAIRSLESIKKKQEETNKIAAQGKKSGA
jgi:HEAT repeat protein